MTDGIARSDAIDAELDELFGPLTPEDRNELDRRIDRARAEADRAYELLRSGEVGVA